MKIFISWSGEKSHKVATVLHEWLPYVIQVAKPFMSSGDILKGERWGDVLAHELEDTQFGIICLTPSNINAPWLSFEAGALSKAVERSFLTPFLFQVKPTDIEGPLAQFQTTTFAKEDITSINNRLESQTRLELPLLRRTFETWWPQLEQSLLELQSTYVHESTTGYDWLYRPTDLSPIQLNTNCRSIWVVTHFMRHALQTTCVTDIVEHNIQSGVKYKFILPASEKGEIHEAREALWRIFSQRSGEREVHEIPHQEFKEVAVTNFLMLNPKAEDEQTPLRVFLELPVAAENNYWIEADKEAAYTFVERFYSIARKAATG